MKKMKLKIQILNMGRASVQVKILKRMLGKEPEDDAQSWAKDEQREKTKFKPWEDKKDYEAIFRKYISFGEDGEEH